MNSGIRLAGERDIPALCEIWKDCFHDPDDYLRFFYRECFDIVTAAVYTVDGNVVSMLHWFDTSFVDGEETLDAKFLYAGGTHPAYRHKGYYGDLFGYVKDYAKKNGCAIFGKPACRDLLPYYKAIGLEPDAYFRLVTVLPGEKEEFSVTPLSPEEYNRMREEAFSSHPHVRWSDRYVRFSVAENAFFGGEVLAVVMDGSSHFLMCTPQGDTLRVTETDLSPGQLRRAAGLLCERFGADRLRAYLPDYLCGEGEEIVSSIVYNAPRRNTYVNLILM